MARIRILELPTVRHGDGTETPFVLIIDQVAASEEDQFRNDQESIDGFTKAIGARGTAVFYGIDVDLPAADPPSAEGVSANLRRGVEHVRSYEGRPLHRYDEGGHLFDGGRKIS